MWNLVLINPSNAEVTFVQRTRMQQSFRKPSEPCHVGIHWKALAEYSQMSTMYQGFSHVFLGFLHHFVLAKLAISIRVNGLKEVFL